MFRKVVIIKKITVTINDFDYSSIVTTASASAMIRFDPDSASTELTFVEVIVNEIGERLLEVSIIAVIIRFVSGREGGEVAVIAVG
jgi:hypothetical protein